MFTIRHASNDEPLRFTHIWALSEQKRLEPSDEQKAFPDEEKRGRLRPIASRDGRDGSLPIHQDVDLYATKVSECERVSREFAAGRKGWIHVAQGRAVIDDIRLQAGDGAAVEGPASVALTSVSKADLLLFDMS
jgi:redox-sensitive bicupin YhaK (pirin superfamily)